MATEPSMEEEAESKPSLFSLIEAGEWEQLDQRLQEDEELANFSPEGRTPLELAAMLGKGNVARVLVSRGGAEIDATNKSGYTALHLCVAWGYLECAEVLVSLGADPQLKTRHGESPIELALRYNREDCVNYLNCVVARGCLQRLIHSARDTLGDSEKISGKWVKDDKQKVTTLCNEKTAWLEHNTQATLSTIQEQVANFKERYQPHLAKLTPPETTN